MDSNDELAAQKSMDFSVQEKFSEKDKNVLLVDNRLKEILAPRYPEIIYEAMAYSVFAGGKRLRPLLLLAAYAAALGGSYAGDESSLVGRASAKCALDFACGIEMIHCYSLIHDDLPAMDDDDFRRGKPTNHKVYGEAIAVLAGDALLNTAFEVMLEAGHERCVGSAILDIAHAAGIGGMLGGQTVDMMYENKTADIDVLMYIHTHKTGAMIGAALLAGARLGGAEKYTLSALAESAKKLGLAFQIKDDILDMTSTTHELGKPTGSDIKNKKLTYPALYGIERSHADYERLSIEAESGINELFHGAEPLMGIIKDMTTRNR